MTRTICFFNTNRPWGGGEKFNHDFALLCRDAGWNVHVAAHRDGELAERIRRTRGITLHELHIGNLSFLNPIKMTQLYQLFRSHKIDTLIMALPADLKAAAPAARLAGVRRVVYRRGIAVPVRNSLLNRWLYGRVLHRLLVNSKETKRCVLTHNPTLIPEERIRLVYNGFDVQTFDSLDATPIVPRKGPEIVIGNAARLTPQKGQRHLLRAARMLKDRGLRFRLLLAGVGEDEAALREECSRLGLDDRTEFVGFFKEIKRFYASVDIFALPSLWEGFGYALVEAMAMELPVAAFSVSSNPEVVADGVTGLLTPPKDETALADSLERLLQNAELRRSMGQAGRARVLERFDTRHALQRFLDAVE
ncbi:Glycosyltransferase involved in cell wall bisynthesis [Paucidesulfovibrio gracilis DSM 16080]|uniref:Glycosyltransferase involved in cell wall bisynthesis n=1 Tax=Paucidesulfovibrio gracilis DSM 16080 TaxID=1121449 RepID=A0A1T4XWF4_9BACT|nr:glycosyltransferase [Paucidesulfovibrio gracilis]SKA93867.1 Glycosyltransferase involved in cell wall bisynthesis [Paucidesulfovibrio gracilis DSM 16080]